MAQLKAFALMLVFCAAAGLIYYLLLPAGNVSQTAKSVISALMLLCVLLPLFSFLGMEAPSFAPAEEQTLDDAAAEILLESVKRQLRAAAEVTVKEFTDLPFEMEISAHITADYGIDIQQVRLTFLEDFGQREALAAALEEAFGFAPSVEIREGE